MTTSQLYPNTDDELARIKDRREKFCFGKFSFQTERRHADFTTIRLEIRLFLSKDRYLQSPLNVIKPRPAIH